MDTPFVIGLLVALSFSCIWLGLNEAHRAGQMRRRLTAFTGQTYTLAEMELQHPFSERAVKPVLQKLLRALGRLAPQRNAQKLRHSLTVAGNPHGLTLVDFMGMRLLLALFFALAGLPLLRTAGSESGLIPFVGLALGPIGFYLPNVWLRTRISARKTETIKALPDALDMLTVAVDAGLGFDAALLKIGERWQNALAAEFSRAVAEMRVGATRREALRNMAARLDVPDVSNFVAVLLQADQLGLSIANILHTQSEQLRIRRRQRVEEQARKAPIKMLFPLIFLIFPAMFAVILGPSVPVLMETFARLGA